VAARNKRLNRLKQALRDGHFADVLTQTRARLSRGEESAALLGLHGRALEGLQRPDEAEACLRDALARYPEDGHLHLYLGNLLERREQPEQALRCFQAATRCDPGLISAWRAQLRHHPLPADSQATVSLLAHALDNNLSPLAQARALFLLGQIHIEADRDATGFEFYRQANRRLAGTLQSDAKEYRLPPGLLSSPRERWAPIPGVTSTPCPLVVVAGLPRSGKSLVEALLSRHPGLHGGGELALVRKAAAGLDLHGLRQPGQRESARQVSRQLLRASHDILGRQADASTRLVDTSPANLPRLGLLGMLQPEVPIILCRREAAELGIALYFKHFRTGHGYSYNLAGIGRALARAESLIDYWAAHLPNPVHIVDYEALARDPLGTANALYRFLGLAPDEIPASPPLQAATGRLFPSRSDDPRAPISDALLGFAQRFSSQLRPMLAARDSEQRKLLAQNTPAEGRSD
tara:strand:+ start:273755 stop:275146 length:1392 start_codon:yes stop_codon:yes gene_type:complete